MTTHPNLKKLSIPIESLTDAVLAELGKLQLFTELYAQRKERVYPVKSGPEINNLKKEIINELQGKINANRINANGIMTISIIPTDF